MQNQLNTSSCLYRHKEATTPNYIHIPDNEINSMDTLPWLLLVTVISQPSLESYQCFIPLNRTSIHQVMPSMFIFQLGASGLW